MNERSGCTSASQVMKTVACVHSCLWSGSQTDATNFHEIFWLAAYGRTD